MYVMVGLGNPGSQYALNRHNIGFMALDVIADAYNFPSFSPKNKALVSEGRIANHKVLLIKPMTYMNLSGQAVAPLVSFYKIPLSQVYVIHDDLDVPFGKIKMKQGGGSGGHNGLSSLDSTMGKDYWRLRMGIGHPGHRDAVSSYVLSNFTSSEQDELITLLGLMAKHGATLFDKEPSAWLSQLTTNIAEFNKSLD
jgi:PTH1 family peptidyl-tRNA hydrolase